MIITREASNLRWLCGQITNSRTATRNKAYTKRTSQTLLCNYIRSRSRFMSWRCDLRKKKWVISRHFNISSRDKNWDFSQGVGKEKQNSGRGWTCKPWRVLSQKHPNDVMRCFSQQSSCSYPPQRPRKEKIISISICPNNQERSTAISIFTSRLLKKVAGSKPRARNVQDCTGWKREKKCTGRIGIRIMPWQGSLCSSEASSSTKDGAIWALGWIIPA